MFEGMTFATAFISIVGVIIVFVGFHSFTRGIRYAAKEAVFTGKVMKAQGVDVPAQVGTAHSHVLVLHLRSQLILQAVDVDEDAVQLFFVGLELFKALLADPLPVAPTVNQTQVMLVDGRSDEGVTLEIP